MIRKIVLAVLLVFSACVAEAAGISWTFTWNNSTSPSAIGNQFGCGPAAGNYGIPIDVKNVQVWTIVLDNAVDWYCNVRAYDSNGNFSTWNGEVKVAKAPPLPPSGLKAALTTAQLNLDSAVAKVASYKSNSNTPNKAAAITALQKANSDMAAVVAQVQ